MLTSDLVQTRLRGKKVYPRYVNARDPDYLEIAERLITTFDEHVGRTRGELEAELREVLGTDTDFQLHKALAKLLTDRCTLEERSAVEPETLRAEVFDAAAAAWRAETFRGDDAHRHAFDRAAVLAGAAAKLGVETDDAEAGLYADLKDQQVLVSWRRCKPQWLLDRYNVALAQGVLLRASEMTIELGAASPTEHRAFFRKVKFFQLMHRIRKLDDGGWRIVLDGPASVFQSSTKYGVQMAAFLPTLLHFEHWSLKAKVLWGPKRRKLGFDLDPDAGLQPVNRLTGQWQPEELRWLPEQMAELDPDWRVSTDGELVDLGGEGVLVPDYVFEHGPSGTKVVMEVFGFWNRGAIESRLELLRKRGPGNVLLALSSQLATGRDDLDDPPAEIYVFRTHPVASKVRKKLKEFLPKKTRRKKKAKPS